jgi:hypothetical protein
MTGVRSLTLALLLVTLSINISPFLGAFGKPIQASPDAKASAKPSGSDSTSTDPGKRMSASREGISPGQPLQDADPGSKHRRAHATPDPPPKILNSFDGINDFVALGFLNPDVGVAAGPTQILESVNTFYWVFDKSGNLLQPTTDFRTFFGVQTHFLSDPKVLYDPLGGRFFLSITDVSDYTVKFAVSATNNATGNWYRYSVLASCFGIDACYVDQPHIGVSNDKFVISGNVINTCCPDPITGRNQTTCRCDQYWVFNKRQMMEGVSNPGRNVFGPFPTLAGVQPAQALSSSDELYMVAAGIDPSRATTNSVNLFGIAGLPPNAGNNTAVGFTLSAVSYPPLAVQRGTTTPVWNNLVDGKGSNDPRVQTAMWFNGKLWFAFNDGCSGVSCIRVTEIDTNTLTIVQSFDWSWTSPSNMLENVFYPALSIDSIGNMVLVFGYSSSADYPSLAVTGQAITDPSNSLETPQTLVIGSQIANSTRYGDYFGAAVDPANSTNIWIAGEYQNAKLGTTGCGGPDCWSTYISAVSESRFVSGSIPSPVTLGALGSPQSGGTVIQNQSGGVGNCLTVASAGTLSFMTANLEWFNYPPKGTMQVSVYTTTGTTQTSSCAVANRIAVSVIQPLDFLTNSFQTFTFTFTGANQASVSNNQLIAALVVVNSTFANLSTAVVQWSSAGGPQYQVVFYGGASTLGAGPCNSPGTIGPEACVVFGLNGLAAPPQPRFNVQPGSSVSTSLNLTSVNGFSANTISFDTSATISVTLTQIDDQGTRTFGLAVDHNLDQRFWATQSNYVIGCCSNPFSYSNTFQLATGTHFVEIAVNASIGQWRAVVTINGGNPVATVDTDINHHVHIVFQVGGTIVTPASFVGGYSISPLQVILASGGTTSTNLAVSTQSCCTSPGNYTFNIWAARGGLNVRGQVIVNVVDFSITIQPPIIAALPTGKSDGTTATTSPEATGVCLRIPVSGNVGLASTNLRIYKGSFTGTTQADVYAATGNPDTNNLHCTPTSTVGISNAVNLNVLTNVYQTINFTFPQGQQGAVYAGNVYMIVFWFNGTFDSNDMPAIRLNNATDASQTAQYYNPTQSQPWLDNVGRCNVQTFCIQYVLYGTRTASLMLAGSTTRPVTVTSKGFTGTVSLSASATPGGPQVSVLPTGVPISCCNSTTATLNINAGAARPGNYTITVTGTGGVISHSAMMSLIISDYNISAGPSTQTVNTGATALYAITINSINGFNGIVNLTAALPTAASCSISPARLSIPPSPSPATLSCSSSTAGRYSISVTGSSGSLTHSASVQLAVGLAYNFKDNFTYASISQMSSIGWSFNTPSQASVTGGSLTLVNNGVAGSQTAWGSVTSGVGNWTVAVRAEWVGGLYGTLQLNAFTARHSYVWHADGYFNQYIFYRDGQIVLRINGYTPALNVWHDLRIDMLNGKISLYFDNSLITPYTETDPGTALTQFGPAAGWQSTDSYTFLRANLLKFTLTLQGYDYDGGQEETLKLNNQLLAQLPPTSNTQNAGKYVTFSVDMTSLFVRGTNTLTFTHANWDCGVVDNTKNVQVTDATGAIIFSDPTVRPLSCTQSITYTFTI